MQRSDPFHRSADRGPNILDRVAAFLDRCGKDHWLMFGAGLAIGFILG